MTSILEVEQLDTLSSNAANTITIGGTNTTTIAFGPNVTTTPSSLAMTPAFQANLSNDANISNLTDTKVQCNSELYDTDGCYDNSVNYRFTPTTAGKYMVYGQLDMSAGAVSDLYAHILKFYKNGSQHTFKYQEYRNSPLFTITTSMSCVIDFNGSTDYVEMYAQIEEGASASQSIIQGYQARTHFGAYRIIGA